MTAAVDKSFNIYINTQNIFTQNRFSQMSKANNLKITYKDVGNSTQNHGFQIKVLHSCIDTVLN